jgi:hypothetical protein
VERLTVFANRDADACEQLEIDQGDLSEFGENLSWLVDKTELLAPQT